MKSNLISSNAQYIGRNLFGFNKNVLTNNVTLDPSINGIISTKAPSPSILHRVHNLQIEEETYITVSGYIYSNKEKSVKLDICDRGHTRIQVTEIPIYFTFTAYADQYVGISNSDLNGFFDIEFDDDDGTIVYISDLKIEKGRIATPWCPALEDSLKYIKPNLLSGTNNRWSNWYTPVTNSSKEIDYNYPLRGINVPVDGDYTFCVQVEFKDIEYSDESGFTEVYVSYNTEGKEKSTYVEKKLITDDGIYTKTFNFNVPPNSTLSVICFLFKLVSSGQFRYRLLSIKEGIVNNPIWCKSYDEVFPNVEPEEPEEPEEPDLTPKPNLFLYYEDTAKLEEGNQASGSPNIFVGKSNGTKGIEETLNIPSSIKPPVEGIQTIYKISLQNYYAYVIYKNSDKEFNLNSPLCLSWYSYGSKKESAGGVTKPDIDVGDGWVRKYSIHTPSSIPFKMILNSPSSNVDVSYVCGFKLEEGEYPTDYIPLYESQNGGDDNGGNTGGNTGNIEDWVPEETFAGKFLDNSTGSDWWYRSDNGNKNNIVENVDANTKIFAFNKSFASCSNIFKDNTAIEYIWLKFAQYGDDAFSGCTNLKQIVFVEGSVVRYATGLFTGCVNLEKLDMSKCENIGGDTILYFLASANNNRIADCTKLTEIYFPEYENSGYAEGDLDFSNNPLSRECAMRIVNSITHQTSKTLTFSQYTYNLLTIDDLATARSLWNIAYK